VPRACGTTSLDVRERMETTALRNYVRFSDVVASLMEICINSKDVAASKRLGVYRWRLAPHMPPSPIAPPFVA
jgi:hypothetical protein